MADVVGSCKCGSQERKVNTKLTRLCFEWRRAGSRAWPRLLRASRVGRGAPGFAERPSSAIVGSGCGAKGRVAGGSSAAC